MFRRVEYLARESFVSTCSDKQGDISIMTISQQTTVHTGSPQSELQFPNLLGCSLLASTRTGYPSLEGSSIMERVSVLQSISLG